MKNKILIGSALLLMVIALLSGCDQIGNQADPYVKDYYLSPEIATPNEDFTLTYIIRNPSDSDREVFLEVEISNGLNKVSAPWNRVSLGDIESKKLKSFFNKFRPDQTEEIQEITIKLYSTETSETPMSTKEIPVEVASEAR